MFKWDVVKCYYALILFITEFIEIFIKSSAVVPFVWFLTLMHNVVFEFVSFLRILIQIKLWLWFVCINSWVSYPAVDTKCMEIKSGVNWFDIWLFLFQATGVECIVFQVQRAARTTISCPARYQLYQLCHQEQTGYNSVDDGLSLC